MPKYEFDVKVFTTITVTAEDEAMAHKEANKILQRLECSDPDSPSTQYAVDTEDGIELVDEVDERQAAA